MLRRRGAAAALRHSCPRGAAARGQPVQPAAGRLQRALPTACWGGSPQRRGLADYRVEPLIPIPSAPVATVAAALADGSAKYLDCRSEQEYAAGVVPGSINLPYPHNGNREPIDAEEFLEDVLAEGFEPDDTIYIGCRKGPRSAMACEVLIDAGFRDVVNVEGGIQEWVARDLPIQPFTG